MWKGNMDLNDFREKGKKGLSLESYEQDLRFGGDLFEDINREYANRKEVEL